MGIRHLRIFKIVCEEESITKAAERLYISQPAVSNTISELEDQLGVELFDRVSRNIYLNETGKLFLSKASRVLELFDSLEEDIKELEEKALIKIGSSITIGNYILPKAIKKFKTSHVNTPTKVIIENALTIEKMLCSNKIDIGLIEGVINNEQLINIPFSSYDLSVISSTNHKFATRDIVELDDLIGEKFLLRERGSAIRDVFDSALLLDNIKINPEWESINSQVLIEGVKENLGLSVLPKALLKDEILKGEIVEITIKDLKLKNTNHIVLNKNKRERKSLKSFIEIVKGI